MERNGLCILDLFVFFLYIVDNELFVFFLVHELFVHFEKRK